MPCCVIVIVHHRTTFSYLENLQNKLSKATDFRTCSQSLSTIPWLALAFLGVRNCHCGFLDLQWTCQTDLLKRNFACVLCILYKLPRRAENMTIRSESHVAQSTGVSCGRFWKKKITHWAISLSLPRLSQVWYYRLSTQIMPPFIHSTKSCKRRHKFFIAHLCRPDICWVLFDGTDVAREIKEIDSYRYVVGVSQCKTTLFFRAVHYCDPL